MTLQETIENSLVNMGLFAEEAKIIIEHYKDSIQDNSIRWNTDVNGYPEAVRIYIFMAVK